MPSADQTTSTSARRPISAAILSGIFPGLGQLYNHERLKGLLFGVAGVLTGFGPRSPLETDIDLGDPATGLRNVLINSVPFLAVALWSVIDAYRVAKRAAPPG